MIVPQFRLNQDEKFLTVFIKAPMAKIRETQIEVDGDSFLFWSKPYHLRLQLPGAVVTSGEENVKWDAASNEFHVKVPKLNQGEHFEGLEMLTKLMTVKSHSTRGFAAPEVLSNSSSGKDEMEEDEEFDWFVEQEEWTEEKDEMILGKKYGFADRYSGVLARFEEEIAELIEIKNPEKKDFPERRRERIEIDQEKFDQEHYWNDLFDQSDEINSLIKYEAPWEKESQEIGFTDEEVFRLKLLPKRDYILSKREKFELLLGLTDILFAYAYDIRTTEGEHTCESGWTISKLAATLCWLEKFPSLKEGLVCSVQRSLIYPLYRNWNLSMKIVQDVGKILKKGRVFVIKCLLDVYRVFVESGDLRYLLNDLFLTDYCVWLQTVKEKTYLSLASCIKKIDIEKNDLNIDLELVEQAAFLALAEHSQNSPGQRSNTSSSSGSESRDDDEVEDEEEK